MPGVTQELPQAVKLPSSNLGTLLGRIRQAIRVALGWHTRRIVADLSDPSRVRSATIKAHQEQIEQLRSAVARLP